MPRIFILRLKLNLLTYVFNVTGRAHLNFTESCLILDYVFARWFIPVFPSLRRCRDEPFFLYPLNSNGVFVLARIIFA